MSIDIPGATLSAYTLVSADIGEQISVRVTATNSGGSTSASSALTSAVIPAAVSGWSRVPLGPGGFISGLALHSDGTKVIRTDTSGAWKWNASTSRWDMLVTTLTMPAGEAIPRYGANPGCYEIEIAKSDPLCMYMMWRLYVWKTLDGGANWTKTARASDDFNANDSVRGNNKKLAIHPTDKNFVICGGTIGVTYSSNGGTSWTTVSTGQIPAAANAEGGGAVGHYLFAFDATGGTIYCHSSSHGLYKSTDAGVTWALAGSTTGPLSCISLKVNSAGKVFALADERDNVTGVTTNIFVLTGSTWATYNTLMNYMRGLAINPADATHIVVTNENGQISTSNNSGATWSGEGDWYLTAPDIPWIENLYYTTAYRRFGLQPGATVEFDPSVSNTLYIGSGLGIWHGPSPVGTATMQWLDGSVGIEQLCAKRLIKPTGGQLVAAVMDQGVFRMDGATYPSTKGIVPFFGAAWDADWCPTDPLTIIAGINTGLAPGPEEQSGFSRDGGATWSLYGADPTAAGGRGAMVACGTHRDNWIHVKSNNGSDPCQICYTTNGGSSWTVCSVPGVSNNSPSGWNNYWLWNKHNLAGDRVTSGTFYAYNQGDGYTTDPGGIYVETALAGLYRSSDQGATWTRRNTGVTPLSYGNARLQSVPERAGHLFAVSGMVGNSPASYVPGIYHSTDGGDNWSAISNTNECYALGFGKPLIPGNYPTIFAVMFLDPGKVFGIYRSGDEGATWTKFGDFPFGCFDTIAEVTGDMSVYGACYVSTYASGIFRYMP